MALRLMPVCWSLDFLGIDWLAKLFEKKYCPETRTLMLFLTPMSSAAHDDQIPATDSFIEVD
jgi:hypothetical protein